VHDAAQRAARIRVAAAFESLGTGIAFHEGMRRLLVALLLIAPGVAGASAPQPLTIAELSRLADTIVVGRVGAAPGGGPVALDVEQVLKGTPPSPLAIAPPGPVARGIVTEVAGAPTFAAGERVLVFLTRRPDASLRVAHLFQGKFSIEPDPVTHIPHAVRRVPDTHAVLDRLPLADALAQVRAALPAPRPEGRQP
jgi:hypothetical protein